MKLENEMYAAGRKLMDEISSEKKFLTFRKLFKIMELNALLTSNI